MAISQSSISMLILSDRGIGELFCFPETLFCKIMAFSSDKIKQALFAQSMRFFAWNYINEADSNEQAEAYM